MACLPAVLPNHLQTVIIEIDIIFILINNSAVQAPTLRKIAQKVSNILKRTKLEFR